MLNQRFQEFVNKILNKCFNHTDTEVKRCSQIQLYALYNYILEAVLKTNGNTKQ